MTKTLQIKTNNFLAHNIVQGCLAQKWTERNNQATVAAWINKHAAEYRNTWFGLKSDLSDKDVERLENKWKRMSTKGSGKLNEHIHFRFATRIANDLGLYFEQAPEDVDFGLAVDAIIVGKKNVAYLQFSERDKEVQPVRTLDGLEHDVVVLKGENIEEYFKTFAANAE